MHAARVALEIPPADLHPIHAFVCESPAVERETILESEQAGDRTALLSFVEGDREAYEATLAEVPYVEDSWTTDGDGGFYVYARTELRDQERLYDDALDRESLLVVPPVELRADRTIRLSLVGRAADISAAMESLPDAVGVEVIRTGEYRHTGTPQVSERQREALSAAWAAGYYAVPREGDIGAVAAELDCAASTASDLLRRAERQLVAAALDEPG